MFAVITPALIIGAYAERVISGLPASLTILWATFVLIPLAHWVWGTGGWLKIWARLICRWMLSISAQGFGSGFGFVAGKESWINYGLFVRIICRLLSGWSTSCGSAGLVLMRVARGCRWLSSQRFVTTNTQQPQRELTWALIEWWHNGTPNYSGTVTELWPDLSQITPACGLSPRTRCFIGRWLCFVLLCCCCH